MGIMKGQGATEYLVLLGAVLIVALVALALLGFFPALSTDAKITQSETYWKGQAKPFSIQEISVTTDGNVTMVLQNKDATGTFTLNSITLTRGTDTPATMNLTNANFAPGDSQTVFNGAVLTGTAAAGTAYSLDVSFAYTSPNGVDGVQTGAQPIMGRYQ